MTKIDPVQRAMIEDGIIQHDPVGSRPNKSEDMSENIEYKVGQEVWFMRKDKPHKSTIKKIYLGGYLHVDYFTGVHVDDIAPTKEALRIKVFGE